MPESPQVPQTMQDALLQIPTRATLIPDLERLAGESSAHQPLSVLLIDLDKFKQVNALHGHENVCLSFDPAPIIQFAAAACRAASVMSYHFESDSIEEIVKLVEHVLADHRDVLREPAIAKDIGEMLDLFVSAGWPQAMNLTFRLDEAIR
jgi:predicted signal transduction protein with EAL and GGDEF domain